MGNLMKSLRLLSNRGKINERANYRVFCFPHAGGGASFYKKWEEAFDGGVDLIGVQYPGHFDRIKESPATNIEELTDPICEEIEAYTDIPVVLFGHSLGALVAYTISKKLSKPPLLLGVSGRNSPQYTLNTSIHKMDVNDLILDLYKQGGTSFDILDNFEAMQLFIPAIRADYQIAETYVLPSDAKLLDCPISIFWGEDDKDIHISAVSDWRFMTKRNFKQHIFSGGHFYLESQFKKVVNTLQQDIEKALDMQNKDYILKNVNRIK